jgi:hypothetical protein
MPPSPARCEELLYLRITLAGQFIEMEHRQIRHLTEHVAEARRLGWHDIKRANDLVCESQERILQLQNELLHSEQQLWSLRFGEGGPASPMQGAQECCLA